MGNIYSEYDFITVKNTDYDSNIIMHLDTGYIIFLKQIITQYNKLNYQNMILINGLKKILNYLKNQKKLLMVKINGLNQDLIHHQNIEDFMYVKKYIIIYYYVLIQIF